MELTILFSENMDPNPKPVVEENGTIVIISASPEGRGHHAMYGPGMIYRRLSIEWRSEPFLWQGRQIVHFSPNVTPRDARNPLTFSAWADVVSYLKAHYDHPDVAVFPCASIQLSGSRLRI